MWSCGAPCKTEVVANLAFGAVFSVLARPVVEFCQLSISAHTQKGKSHACHYALSEDTRGRST